MDSDWIKLALPHAIKQDHDDKAKLASMYLDLDRCGKCGRINVKGFICPFCGNTQ